MGMMGLSEFIYWGSWILCDHHRLRNFIYSNFPSRRHDVCIYIPGHALQLITQLAWLWLLVKWH